MNVTSDSELEIPLSMALLPQSRWSAQDICIALARRDSLTYALTHQNKGRSQEWRLSDSSYIWLVIVLQSDTKLHPLTCHTPMKTPPTHIFCPMVEFSWKRRSTSTSKLASCRHHVIPPTICAEGDIMGKGCHA